MSAVKDAYAVLAVLHLGEVVAEEVAKKHATGENFTLGDLAGVVASSAVSTVDALGLTDHPFRMAPPKRGRKAADSA